VQGSTVTLTSDDQGEGDGKGAPIVDTSAATVVLDGVASGSGSLAVGDRVLALGAPDDAGVLQAAVVLAFDGQDDGPAPFVRHGGD
jgi:hypothetical protein